MRLLLDTSMVLDRLSKMNSKKAMQAHNMTYLTYLPTLSSIFRATSPGPTSNGSFVLFAQSAKKCALQCSKCQIDGSNGSRTSKNP
jgi:hypothetical protein